MKMLFFCDINSVASHLESYKFDRSRMLNKINFLLASTRKQQQQNNPTGLQILTTGILDPAAKRQECVKKPKS